MKIAKELAQKAAQCGICNEWYNDLKVLEDKQAMIRMYLKGIDFCLANDYPNNEYIRTHFKGVMEDFGVFLDDSFEVTNIDKCVALGRTTGTIEISDYSTSEIFVKHSSNITIVARDSAFVMVDVFDCASVRVQAHGQAKVCVNRYGNSTVEHETTDGGMVKIVEKHKKTY